jgi:hypothetical protein
LIWSPEKSERTAVGNMCKDGNYSFRKEKNKLFNLFFLAWLSESRGENLFGRSQTNIVCIVRGNLELVPLLR